MSPPLAESAESPLEHSKDAQGDSPATEANKLYFGIKAAKLKLDLALDTSYWMAKIFCAQTHATVKKKTGAKAHRSLKLI